MVPAPAPEPTRRREPGRLALRVALLLGIAIASSARGPCKAPSSGADAAAFEIPGSRVEVACVQELHVAFQDEWVTHVALLPGVSWNFSRQAWGGDSVPLHRALLLEGVPSKEGQPPYVDMNQLAELVVVGTNGSLHLRGLFLDDCLLPAMPLVCLAAGTGGGSLLLDSLVLGDASCTNIRHSAATNWLLKAAYSAAWQSSWRPVDGRSVHVADTGEVWSAAEGVRWRIINCTLRCTGNDTHALSGASNSRRSSSEMQLALSVLATAVALLAGLYWRMNHGVVHAQVDESAEEAAARAMGAELLGVIGKGTRGTVFRARFEGKAVAVKVVCFTDPNGRAAAEVADECRHAMACSHPCITSCLAHSTVAVRAAVSRRRRFQSGRHMLSAVEPQIVDQRQRQWRQLVRQQERQQQAGSLVECDEDTDAQPGQLLHAGGDPVGSSSDDQGRGSSMTASSCMADSLVSLLAMEHCPLGNLHQAITAGRFHDSHSGKPNLDWVLRTGLDIALALQYLHRECNIVHRDVSTNNILLTPDPSDFRGFRAKLTDFGLSMELLGGEGQTMSQLKGTVHFMPPEVFTSGEVQPALDMYSLGIVLYWMVAREEPFVGLAPYQVVGKKLEEAHRRQRLELPPCMPPDLQALVWDCTHWDPRQRPTAGAVARRLASLICKLSGKTWL